MLLHRRGRTKRGFTIVEILISISVISIALLGTIAAIAFGLRASALGGNNTVAIQINRKVFELVLQSIYAETEAQFAHSPGDPNAARGTAPWQPIFIENPPVGTKWFSLKNYGFLDSTTAEAIRFVRDTDRFELDVSVSTLTAATTVPPPVDTKFSTIVVQTRWQEKSGWKVVRTEGFGLPL